MVVKLDLSKYTGYYCNMTEGLCDDYDVIYLIRPEWWVPNKKLKFKRIIKHERKPDVVSNGRLLRKGDVLTTTQPSGYFWKTLEYVAKHFK